LDRVLVDLLTCPLTGGRLEPWSAREETGRAAAGTLYRRRFPSDIFLADNPPVAEYLPERAVVSHAAEQAIAVGQRTEEVGELLASFVVLATPGEPWFRR
jgi:hypothetical protein